MTDEVYFQLIEGQDQEGNAYHVPFLDFIGDKVSPYGYHYFQLEDHSLSYDFDVSYKAKAKGYKLTADYYMLSNLASEDFVQLLDTLDIAHRSIPLDITLYRNKKPQKQYYLTYFTDIISIIDKRNSEFQLDLDKYTNEPIVQNGFTIYDKISKFIIDKEKVKGHHIFYCTDISKIICSSIFRNNFLKRNLIGIDFKLIDAQFEYNSMVDFGESKDPQEASYKDPIGAAAIHKLFRY